MNEGNKIITDLNGDGVADILTCGLSELKIMFGDPLGNEQVQTLQAQSLERATKELPALGEGMHGVMPPLHLYH